MNRKIYCANNYRGYASWLIPMGISIVDSPMDADILLLEGGQDIDYRFYSKTRGRSTGSPGQRDERELALYNHFNKKGKYIVGTCRGAQLACALQPGGALIQDMSHPGRHNVTTNTGDEMSVISLHHQCQLLTNIPPENYELLAWANRLSPYHYNGDDQDLNLPADYKEPEVVVYCARQIAIQSHPEMMAIDSKFVQYCQNLVRKYILNEPEIPLTEEIGIGRKKSLYTHYALDWD